MTENQHTIYFELRDSLGGPGCALCALALRSMRRYFDALGYESVNDPGIRSAVRAARGFCEVHGRMLREAHDALGTAIIHRDVLTVVACDATRKLYRMECESFSGAGTPSVADRSRRAIGRAIPMSHSNPFQAAVRSSRCLDSACCAASCPAPVKENTHMLN